MSTSEDTIAWTSGELDMELAVGGDHPVRVTRLRHRGGTDSLLGEHPLVELMADGERRAKSGLGYARSAVGSRLRYRRHDLSDAVLRITQSDHATGLEVTTTMATTGSASVRFTQTVRNDGEQTVELLAVTSLAFKCTTGLPADIDLVQGASGWLGEGAWTQTPLRDAVREVRLDVSEQDARSRYPVVSTGAWTTGTAIPTAALVNRVAGTALAWQIESSAGWLWELIENRNGLVLDATGPTDAEHHFSYTLRPGDSFDAVPAALAVGRDRDDAFGALWEHRRRTRVAYPADAARPVVYNDFMNTLMGQPTTPALERLIPRAAAVGADVFCIDAGWFSDSADYWTEIGEWREAPTRFRGGLSRLVDQIRDAGMTPGLWIEPEIIGEDSPLARSLPPSAFFQRHGHVVVEHARRHLDLRHPAARAHLDASVDGMIADFGIGFLKIDYNIDPGPGTDATGAPGEGLLAHARAFQAWLADVRTRHPQLLVETCASGAMRMDHALVSHAHVQSTSDQQDAGRYATVAAAAGLSLLPEQAANWAYPAADMSDGELDTTLVNAIMGRFCLSGFLDRLSSSQLDRVTAAVDLHREVLAVLEAGRPLWPAGIPGWNDEVLAFGADDGRSVVVGVWSRGDAADLRLPASGPWRIAFGSDEWTLDETGRLAIPAGPAAAVLRLERATTSH